MVTFIEKKFKTRAKPSDKIAYKLKSFQFIQTQFIQFIGRGSQAGH